jgi:hypothetical protein
MYEEFVLPVILEMNRRRGTALPTGWHYCGSGMHLVPVFARHYPLERIDEVTHPVLDIAEIRRILGPKVWVKAQIEDGIVHSGGAGVRASVAALASSGAMGSGRLCESVGDMLPGTAIERRRELYAAVRELMRYGNGGERGE